MISIVTGTINRKEYLPELVKNTVERGDNIGIELVLVDGGSTDGTIEYLEELNHPNIKLIKHGERSSYPHYMDLGIENASYDLVCQWNDDVLLVNTWEDVLAQIDDEHDAYIFNWKTGSILDMKDPEWLKCDFPRDNEWIIINNIDLSYPLGAENVGELCMNYGIYKKDVFKKYGGYNKRYRYYYSDAEMAVRSYYAGCEFKNLLDIRYAHVS